mmetsp:Transcript_51904/g.137254  ORF Transcript_51904/g.137254 Transcript_51904/m.137254 type:complete len:229 (-) Transcript_51904:2584-3270(-)
MPNPGGPTPGPCWLGGTMGPALKFHPGPPGGAGAAAWGRGGAPAPGPKRRAKNWELSTPPWAASSSERCQEISSSRSAAPRSVSCASDMLTDLCASEPDGVVAGGPASLGTEDTISEGRGASRNKGLTWGCGGVGRTGALDSMDTSSPIRGTMNPPSPRSGSVEHRARLRATSGMAHPLDPRRCWARRCRGCCAWPGAAWPSLFFSPRRSAAWAKSFCSAVIRWSTTM